MSNIKILIACHKAAEHPTSEILLPIQVGAGVAKTRFAGMLQDDAGENISAKNPMYCELTAQYWAWKNMDADYYGFCHYRRHFSFAEERFPEDEWGNIIVRSLDKNAVAKYALSDAAIARAVEGYDVITTTRKDLRRMGSPSRSVTAQYHKAARLHAKDLDCVRAIIDEKYPAMSGAAKRHCDGHITSFCNMYILKKQIFFDYCEWMFDVLAAFEKRTDMSFYSTEALRTPGHLSERLFGIYYLWLCERGDALKTKELQCVLFESTDPQETLAPAFGGSEIPIVFAANNRFAPMAATAIRSVAEHASSENRYDIVVLESNITLENKALMRGMLAGRENMSLRFFNAERLLGGYKLKAQEHISVETYFRFLIQDILPDCDKVLYLDGDLVVTTDVAALYEIQLGENLLAAARDPDFLGQINGANPLTMDYCRAVLQMKDPYSYFQAGVLLLNTKAMRAAYSLEEWLTFATKQYKYSDQDVLNIHCEGRVKYLDMSWNLLTDCAHGRIDQVITYAPNDVFAAYKAARLSPKIIHFAGYMKPWHHPDEDFAASFWKYARLTPFYEALLFHMDEGNAWHIADDIYKRRGIRGLLRGLFSLPRRAVDAVFPKGSAGREALKKVYHIFVPLK